ncbi:limbic system-associated membrane protein isoform X3 [Drosophila busckii]|uniref:limbic system-associated membrane protein isoform X3 n=1 Tax=Drosophila busckii TaxID=30019 RepID=UPI00083F1C8C|nr:limbic system-associated membrane protein isoform X3 [Drosophila busckii]
MTNARHVISLNNCKLKHNIQMQQRSTMPAKYINNKFNSPASAWAIATKVFVVVLMCQNCSSQRVETQPEVIVDPKFSYPIANVTAPVGRDAFLTCVVQDLGPYKVAWLRVDTQTILTIQNHVITKNQRIGIANSEHKTWTMRIRDIKESDKGWYMCQINTDPMKSQMGYLDVVVPPDILDYPTSTDMVVREGSNVTLKCAATGSPEPTITWRRESGVAIELANGEEVASVEGTDLIIPRVKRQHMGAYLCIASNGVPPSVSKRITLVVHFPPMITVSNQLIGAVEGKGVTLECQSEAYPKSINYWTRERGEIVPPGGKYSANVTEIAGYRSSMRLHINPLTQAEFGAYRCVAKNSLGDTDGTIKLYRIPPNAVNYVDNFEARHKADLSQESIDNLYGGTSAASTHWLLVWLLPLLLLLMTATTLTWPLRETQLTLLPQTLTQV